MNIRPVFVAICWTVLIVPFLNAQENTNLNKFKQLKQELATPNNYRTASGSPGHEYYQQQADYKINVKLNEEKLTLSGEEEITYYNNSPDPLTYLWLQLDQNVRAKDAQKHLIKENIIGKNKASYKGVKALEPTFDGGFKIEEVKDLNGKALSYIINNTMMRINLPKALLSGEQFSFKIKWWYNINDRMEMGGRSGYEYFAEEDNYLFTIAQFFPRMCVYNDVEGWQNKQFLGRGEFALAFGDYDVSITVPSDHIVSATGVLKNAEKVLTTEQIDRLKKAEKEVKNPVFIVTQSEAEINEESKSKGYKTWIFQAENVRDFAFASSRKFIWDAMAVPLEEKKVMAMSFYPKEGNPLWERYSTKAVAHTLKVYSKYTFEYPYPVAQSVNAKYIGMEYPMICFNWGRCEKDGTYSKRTKYSTIGVIIHEIGHNYFPMIVNSDERQWTWMDEGLNSFLEFLAEQEWERDFPSRRGLPKDIVPYMKGEKSRMTPIMTNSESIPQFGYNAYWKPATALNILRETIMGRPLFDFAFKTYAEKWMFKHPTPADFFRTMEDASGIDLDWFWRGWFYTTDHVDIAIKNVKWYQINTKNPEIEKAVAKELNERKPRSQTHIINEKEIKSTYDEEDKSLRDFYSEYDKYKVTALDKDKYEREKEFWTEDQKRMINSEKNYYEIKFENKGGLVMPIILLFELEDGEKIEKRIPAEIWRINSKEVNKIFVFEKEVKQVTIDPYLETADTDLSNNNWPPKMIPSRFELYERKYPRGENQMQKAKRAATFEKEK